MSYHWDGPNPIAASQKLKNFLDPSGSGQTIVNGSYVGEGAQPCGNFGACSVSEAAGLVLENQGWSLSPNPASGSVEISMPAGAPLVELRVYDARGRMLESRMPNSLSESLSLDVSHLSKGLHFFTVRTSDGTSSTLKLVIE
jgi:hypothetical protein